MIDMTNFTVSGTYYTATYVMDSDGFTFKCELAYKDTDDSFVTVPTSWNMREMGKELIALADRADKIIAFARKEECYEVL